MGSGLAEHLASLRERRSGLRANDFTVESLECAIGRVAGLESQALPAEHARHECRNNRLAWRGLNTDGFLESARGAIRRYGAHRVALLLATSTSSIGATEEAYARLDESRMPEDQRLSKYTRRIRWACSWNGARHGWACLTVATACSSSAKIFAKAERLIRLGIVDAAVLAGVDTCAAACCSFQLVGAGRPRGVPALRCASTRHLDRRGSGIRPARTPGSSAAPRLIGWGESSDAHHMSTPHPQGLGARLALQGALDRAGLRAKDIDYINLHGTATPKNDEVEGTVLTGFFPERTRASSSKGWSGHTLGAAGILEAVITLLALQHGFVPGTLNCEQPDPVCGAQLALANEERELRHALSNSFGFGGSNCTLAFARGGSA